ncbi:MULTISPECIES: DNA cytosine methyltransferase [Klebsiella]|uniref:DNA cytosine methyltransferase n=1 Tax=Klebsiella TaxID=570 RepID=UPI000CD1205D|nr:MULTISPECIES: DNA cytosine methyltransferase [Klebsiella]AUU95659.1 DNA cytosine methyltransferase [Klebsiella pneumoniae]MBA7935663.1 DNA cytosine methyltransferase [Klebsiella sp. RHBSTW-00215]POW76910.1 DNA cytosine methyltransferase [Klebsiella pneumoniae]HBU7382611.1 DNA cytosine methyltransferase [Klebsiella pneumoniae]HBU7384640.1 DNA cytosine methyltransferase [Klebsiella pneumoniae]
MREIIVDNFAGGGGASTGIELAIGRSVDIAINHDENAIAMHKTNHPDTLHYCESVFDVDPVAATGGNPVGLAWFSPDCRHFSKAKGAKPVKKEIRGLAWIVVRWALAKRPRVVMLENVEEFKTWGPLLEDEARPDPTRIGETFAAFVGMLSTGIPVDHPALAEACEFLSIPPDSEQAKALISGLGYTIDYRELRACDFGAPTIRKRFFMVMRCDGETIHWPAPTHGDPKSLEVQSGKLAGWRTAAECIDWSIPCQSIFDRKKPLAENTLKRIARGIERFVLNNPTPFIVKCNHTSTRSSYDCFRGQDIDSPLQTITKTHGYAVVTPHVTKFRTGATGQECTEPLPTVTAGSSQRPGGNGHALGIVKATLIPFIAGNGGSEYQAKPRAINRPAHTILKQSRACLVAPVIARQFGASVGHGADEPSATITAGGGGKSQLVTTFLAKHFGGNYTGPGAAIDQPAHTVTTTDHHALVTAQIVGVGGRAGQSRPRDADEPLQTLTTKADAAMVTSHLVHLRGTCKDGRRVDEPVPTITAGGQHVGEVRAFLMKYYGNEKSGVSLDEPLGTVTTNDRFGLVTVEGVEYQIVDIGMRMLQPHELYRAQGFPAGYIIDQDYRGNRYAKDKQVARCGNAVPPPFAEALVRANLPEMCIPEQREVA